MQPVIDLVTLWTDDAPRLAAFYRDVIGMEVENDMGGYVEFRQPGVRFAICERKVMVDVAGLAAFAQRPEGQRVELAFPAESPEAVDAAYDRLVEQGATPVRPPADMPWGQRTGLFADPDGNIHEVFAPLPGE